MIYFVYLGALTIKVGHLCLYDIIQWQTSSLDRSVGCSNKKVIMPNFVLLRYILL